MLEIKNLSVGVLKNISLFVGVGARALLRGANGSGKTTLANAIIGIVDVPAKSGRIFFNGADITDLSIDARGRAGIFLGAQNVPEIPGLSIMTFLKHSFIAHYGDVPVNVFMKKLKSAQERLCIPDAWLGRSVNIGFSGGEKKRIMFLHLLIIAPKFAILDEPDSGADESARKLFGEIIIEMKDTTFLVISHQRQFFRPTAEITLQGGEIIAK
jgi:Fe-S cluster assembly ATP-binding protein